MKSKRNVTIEPPRLTTIDHGVDREFVHQAHNLSSRLGHRAPLGITRIRPIEIAQAGSAAFPDDDRPFIGSRHRQKGSDIRSYHLNQLLRRQPKGDWY